MKSRSRKSKKAGVEIDRPAVLPAQATPSDARKNTFSATSSIYAYSYPDAYKEDIHLGFFYTPHSLSALAIMTAILAYLAFNGDTLGMNTTKTGLVGCCFVFLLFAMLQFNNGPFIRPHPALWRVVRGVSIIYLLALVFLLFQSRDDARQLLQHLDPKLGVPLPERSYADDCRVYTPEDPHSSFANIRDALVDEFVLAHIFGWFGKMILLRDYKLAWALSLLFEWLEISFEHMLPNFKECWWDHLILDVLVCNFAGMYMAKLFISYLSVKEYNWTGINDISSIKGKVQRSIMQFTPHTWTVFSWEIMSSFKRFAACIFILAAIEICELCAFFLKTILWIPPPHPLNVVRLGIWWLLACPAIREYYQFVVDKTCKKVGVQAWIAAAIILMESLICIKFGEGMFPTPMPLPIFLSWVAIIGGLAAFTIYYFVYRRWNGWAAFRAQLLS